MKQILLSFAIATLCIGYVATTLAGEVEKVLITNVSGNEKKVRIAVEQLPEQVISAFENSEYNDWQISEAYQVEGEENDYYELHLNAARQDMTEEVVSNSETEDQKIIKIDLEGGMME